MQGLDQHIQDPSWPGNPQREKDSYNECVICGNKEFTAGEPIRHYVCDECSERHAEEEANDFELEAGFE